MPSILLDQWSLEFNENSKFFKLSIFCPVLLEILKIGINVSNGSYNFINFIYQPILKEVGFLAT